MTTVQEVEQRAIAWCKTTPDYVNPAIDCKLDTSHSEPVEVNTYPYSDDTYYHLVHVWLKRNGGFGGRASARWNERDTDDTDCAPEVVDRVYNYNCIDPDKLYTLEEPKENTDPEMCTGNPCDPASGVKTQTEVDFRVAAEGVPSYARFYTSKGSYRTGLGMAPGWRHTYSRTLDEEPDRYPTVFISSPVDQSSFYHSASDACSQGWDDIKASVFAGELTQATGTLVGGNTCKISEGGQTKAFLRVRAGGPWVPFTPPSSNKTVVRPNGSSIEFEQDGAGWAAPLSGTVSLEQSGSQWVFTDANDIRETYDSSGRLVAITHRNGQTETLDYELTVAQGGDDDAATLDRVTGPFGHTLSFAYDANGRLASVTTPDGTIAYAFDTNENLTTVTYPDLTTRQYVYEDTDFAHHLTGIIDENSSRFATWAYDDAGRAILSEHAGGKESVTLTYNANGTTTIVSGNGASRTYTFGVEAGQQKLTGIMGDVCSDCAGGNIKSRTYDTNGFLEEATDWNNVVTKTARNSRGLVETLTEALGTTDQRVTTTVWHADYRLPTKVTTPKNVTDTVYANDGNPTSITISGGGETRAWAMTYNSNGQLLTVDGPRTDVTDITTLTYHNCSTGGECGQLASVTNALGHVTNYSSYDAGGRLLQMTEPNGLETTYTYDSRGNVLTVTQTPNVGSALTTTMTYDDVGQLATLTTPEGVVLTYAYTAAHYLESVIDNAGNKISYSYDAMGNLTDEDTYDPYDVLARSMDYAYGLDEQLDGITNGSIVTTFAMDEVGNLSTETDGLQNATLHAYDALNRLNQTTDALSGITNFGYDAHDNLTSVAAPNNATTGYAYDDLDNMTSETSPDRGLISYTYDEAGNRLTALDARGITATYTYDALNRITSISYPTTGENVTYAYDNVSGNGIGRPASITDQSGTTSYTYDEFGRLATDARTISGMIYTTSYAYDDDGNIKTITYPSGRIVDYTRNTTAKIVQVTSNMSGIVKSVISSAAYEPFGPVSVLTYGNGVSFSYTHNADYSVDEITAAGISGRSYSYDAAGNVVEILDSVDLINLNLLEYDALNRLFAETSDVSESYGLAVLQDNPAAFWRLNETGGSIAFDATSNGFDSTYVGTFGFGDPSLMAGGDASVRVASAGAGYVQGSSLSGVVPTGIEMWFDTDDVTSWWRHLLGVYDVYPNAIQITHYRTSGQIVITDWQYNTLLMSDGSVSTGESHHLAIWYEAAANKTFMMIDGVVQQNTYNGNVFPPADPVVLIGRYDFGHKASAAFLGNFDDVAVYSTAVTAATFADHYVVGSTSDRSTRSYTYDSNGNRLSLTNDSGSESYTYAAGSNVLDSIASATLQHDVAGNRISDAGGIRTYGYDDTGRLDEFLDNGVLTASYVHNAMGQRAKKTVGAATTIYIYDTSGNLIAEHDSNGTLIRDYVWMNGVPVAQIDQGEAFSYLHFDHLGTPRLATDDAQTVVWRWDSDAFGSTAANDDPDGNGTPLTVNLRFPGQYYDVETGFHYNYYRTYDPATGRYLESDPIGLAAGPNTYAYVGNMPTMYVDPFGLEVQLCRRPADLPWPLSLGKHSWIKTDTVEAGMGADPDVIPAQGNSDKPFTSVQVVDHTGQSLADNSTCEVIEDVDEDKVNELLRLGRPLGRWGPANHCQSFTNQVLWRASNRSPLAPPQTPIPDVPLWAQPL